MAWLRLDDGFPEHRKLLALKRPERWTWMELMCYCARQSDMGLVPDAIGDVLRHVTPSFVQKCVSIGLLDQTDGETRVHDWHDYNPKDPTNAIRQMRHRNKLRNGAVTANVTDDGVTKVTPRAQPRARGPSPTPLITNQPTVLKDVGSAGFENGIGNLDPHAWLPDEAA